MVLAFVARSDQATRSVMALRQAQSFIEDSNRLVAFGMGHFDPGPEFLEGGPGTGLGFGANRQFGTDAGFINVENVNDESKAVPTGSNEMRHDGPAFREWQKRWERPMTRSCRGNVVDVNSNDDGWLGRNLRRPD